MSTVPQDDTKGKDKENKGVLASLKSFFQTRKTSVERHKHTDWDEVFKYKTIRMVVFLDARLGLLNLTLTALIFVYIICFALIINKGYIEKEQAFGQIELTVLGKTHFRQKQDDKLLVVDENDMVDPPLEAGALFVASRLENTKQARGTCGNEEHECIEDTDCPKEEPVYLGKCVDGLCQELGWCPPSDPASDATQVWDFEHPENVTIWIKAAISFPKLAPNRVFTTMVDSKPIYVTDDPQRANAHYLKDILTAANVALVASKANGAMINVMMEWNCQVNTGEGCTSPILTANRLDVGKAQGFYFADAIYSRDAQGHPKSDVRFYSKRVGYRLLISSRGIGSKTSIAAIILQISSGIALLSAAKSATDFLMLFVLPQKDFYRKYKEEETPDFSDVREMIRESEEQMESLRGNGQSRYAASAIAM